MYKAEHKKTNQQVVIKIASTFNTFANTDHLPEEVRILLQLHNAPGIISLLDFYCTQYYYFLIFKQESHLDLHNYLQINGPLNENSCRTVVIQLFCAFNYLNKQGILHGDIKDDNILINPIYLDIKIIDFGRTLPFHTENYDNFLGATAFAPPEYISTHKFKATPYLVWSIGLLLLIMVTNKHPSIALNNLHQIKISKTLYDLIRQCTQKCPITRISYQTMQCHSWIFNNASL